MAKMRLWTVVLVNCDSCGSYHWARLKDIDLTKFAVARCRICRKPLGDMECRFIGRVRAETEEQAIKKATNEKEISDV